MYELVKKVGLKIRVMEVATGPSITTNRESQREMPFA